MESNQEAREKSRAICRYVATRNKAVPDHWDLRLSVRAHEAVDPLDVGDIVMLAITRERCEFEVGEMRKLGYEMVSELREIIANIC